MSDIAHRKVVLHHQTLKRFSLLYLWLLNRHGRKPWSSLTASIASHSTRSSIQCTSQQPILFFTAVSASLYLTKSAKHSRSPWVCHVVASNLDHSLSSQPTNTRSTHIAALISVLHLSPSAISVSLNNSIPELDSSKTTTQPIWRTLILTSCRLPFFFSQLHGSPSAFVYTLGKDTRNSCIYHGHSSFTEDS